ncbi:MAG TPA: hypothetical protein VN616_17590 [Puia sp.]|nr:hypothetical protein [Puia sp.]
MGLKLVALSTICLLFSIACRKQGDNADSNCISAVTTTAAARADQTDSAQTAVIDALFARNNLPTGGLQFFSIDSNSYQPPGYNGNVDQAVVIAYLWVNDLPVFVYNDYFVFYNGVLQPDAIVWTGALPPPDPDFRLTLDRLRVIYNNNFEKVTISGGPSNVSSPRHPPASFGDSCVTAQAGYLDANHFFPAIPAGTRLVKGWKLTPVGLTSPMVFVDDSTGSAWPVSVAMP